MRRNVYSVGQVNAYIKNMFAQDFMLRQISVSGEISNCKYHSSGHIYFTLKDSSGIIQAVMFAGNRRGLTFHMKEGDNVVVTGSIEVYERDGKYQLYAREITLAGAGDLYLKYEALKKELEEMGMFAKEYKQDIPKYAKTIGIVTAPTGAAVRDINNIAQRRNPYVQLILYPALVQGEGAAQSIVNGIHAMEQLHPDLLILGRGGGSIEDLWAFNEEIVARAIFDCPIPVISAVGHETDTTIADYVADMRAPTPSAAAELAVDDFRQIMQEIRNGRERLERGMNGKLELYRMKLAKYQMRMQYLNPESKFRDSRQRLIDTENRIRKAMQDKVLGYRHQLGIYLERYRGLSPLEKLNQGYAFVADEQGRGIYSVEQVQPGDIVKVNVTDGVLEAEIRHIRREDWENGTADNR